MSQRKTGAQGMARAACRVLFSRSIPLTSRCYISLEEFQGFSMRALILMLGLPDMSTPQLIIFLALVGVGVLLFGWISDLLLRDGAFGIIMNGLIILAGAIGGTLLWRKLDYAATWRHLGYALGSNPAAITAFVALGAGLATLILLMAIRRWL